VAGLSLESGGAARALSMLSPDLLREGMAPLPGTEDEIKSISILFPENIILLGRDMTRRKVEETIRGKSTIHFATHGLLDPAHPLFSGLVLSDTILTTGDIFGLDLEAGLVVLSACNTAGGELSGGDELVGMSRAFMYAGSPSVVASLWSVSDESTTLLMKLFYRELRKGSPVARALQEAQKELIEKYPEPFYWAPFVLIGRQ
jgi:CHAT domain-containing protein